MNGPELYLGGFIKNTFNIGLRLYTYEWISFELGVILDMTKLYTLFRHD